MYVYALYGACTLVSMIHFLTLMCSLRIDLLSDSFLTFQCFFKFLSKNRHFFNPRIHRGPEDASELHKFMYAL